MNLNEHIIIEEYDDRAVYEIHELPKRGELIKGSTVLKKGDRFTQGDIRTGVLQYRHTKYEGDVEMVFDEFFFKVPLNDKDYLLPETPRARCLPATSVPFQGIHRFRIRITCVPFPRRARNNVVSLMETETKCLSRNDLFYTSMTSQIQAYFNKPEIRVKASEVEVFQSWKRFAGEESFESGGRAAPPTSDVKRWEYNTENDSFYTTSNTSNFTGVVNTTTSEAFKLKATLSSPATDDDYIGIVVAYYEVDGVPQTIGVGRSGGGVNPSTSASTWFVYQTNGNQKTILTDYSHTAPNQYNNTKSQKWSELGKTTVEVVRKGNTVTAKCSQFSFGNPNAGDIDDGTLMTFTLPGDFALPNQYGFSSFSQAFSTFENIEYAELPWPEIVPPVPEPPYDRLFERIPIEYTVTRKSGETRGRFLLNGQPLNVGDKFYHKDIDRGLLCIEGLFKGPGKETFNFTACANGNKCTSGVFTANVIEWPYPKATRNNAEIDECDDNLVLTPDMFTVEVEFGSTPSQIQLVLDEAATIAANNDNNRVGIQPTSFTMQDIIDGNVFIFHECGQDPTLWKERLIFTACTQYNKCRSVILNVKVIPLPVVKPPIGPTETVTPAGCYYGDRVWFDGTPILEGTCGLWASIRGRVLPPPEDYAVGTFLYMPDVQPEPKTMVLVPVDGGLDWRESPIQIPNEPTGEECAVQATAPNTDRSKSLIELGLWGTWGDGAPGFMLRSGGKNLLQRNAYVTDIVRPNQGDGEQYFSLTLPTAQLGNGPLELVYTDNEPVGYEEYDRNLRVKWITVNGKKTTFNKLLRSLEDRVVVPGPFGYAPYLGAPNTCFTALDGTVWATNQNGEWAFVEGGTGDMTPIITASNEFAMQVNTLDEVPAGGTLPVYVKPIRTVLTPVKEDFIPEIKPFTETFILDDFQWIDSNEYWLPLGASFDLYFFANRYYTRFDILPDGGHQIIHPTDPLVAGINGGILAKRYPTTTYNNSQNALNVFSAVGSWPTKVSQAVVPGKTMWEGISQENGLIPFDADPYHTNQYLVKIAGTNSYAGFVASQRPKLLPKTYTGPRWYDSNGNPGFSKTYEAWEEADYKTVWSFTGYNGDYKQVNADFPLTGKGEVNAYGGAAYGTIYPWLHFDTWKLFYNYNYKPAKQPMAWCTARLSFLDYGAIRDSKEARNGGPVNSAPPSSPTTMTFRVRAYDIATGEEKIRTYKIHWTATGKSPKGKTQMRTDTTTGVPIPPGTLPPRPGTAVCFYNDRGEIGSCRILKDNEL